jgi:hypothetical protein
MRVLVCGGRDFTDQQFVIDTLNRLSLDWPRTPTDKYGNWLPAVTIITGGAKGADQFAADWAAINCTDYKEFKPDWSYGKRAGPIRNQKMLDEGKPDLVVAFPGGRGTADMVRRASKAGVEVISIQGGQRK